MKTNRTRYGAIQEAMTRIKYERWDGRISVYETNSILDDGAKKFGVNWCAIGTTSAEETMKFARDLNEAARIAEMLTSIEIIEVWNAEETILNKENFGDFVEIIQEAMVRGSAELIRRML